MHTVTAAIKKLPNNAQQCKKRGLEKHDKTYELRANYRTLVTLCVLNRQSVDEIMQ